MASKRVVGWRLFLATCFTWSSLVLVLYAAQIAKLPAFRLRELYTYSSEFFLWQCLGYVLLLLVVTLFRPTALGRFGASYLALSSIAMLSMAFDWRLPVEFVVFMLWCFSAVNTCRIILRRLIGDVQTTRGLAAAGLYGAAIGLTFFLGLFKLMTMAWVAFFALVLAVPGALELLKSCRSRSRSLLLWFDSLGSVGVSALQALWLSLAVAFVWANTPETQSDSIRQHLPYVQHVVRHGGFETQAVNFGRLKPKPIQAVAAAGHALGGYRVAKWISWIVLLALAQLVYEEICRRSRRRDLGMLATATIVSCPLLLYLSTTLYIDQAMVFLCLASFISLLRGLHEHNRGSVLFSAFLIGATIQTKYNALIFLVFWTIFLVGYAIRNHGLIRGAKWCLLPAVVLTVTASPWYLYTLATTGNPVFPYFNGWFQSPLWPEGMSTSFSLDKLYTLGDHYWDRVLFPWTITFHTSRFSHHSDGSLGFVLLALLPMVLVIRRRPFDHGLDFGLAGVAITASVCYYTPFARYWLAGLPLMIMCLFLLLGNALDRAQLRPRVVLSTSAAALVLVALTLQIPIWTADWRGYPWRNYVGEISEAEHLLKRVKGYPAIRQLNARLMLRDRVLATGYSSIHTIEGAPYEFPFWHKNINQINDEDDLEAFLRQHNIRYWAVDLAGADALYFNRSLNAGARYWQDSRLVSAFSTLAVFDVSEEPRPPRFAVESSRLLKPRLISKKKPDGAAGWRDAVARQPTRASRVVEDHIEIPNRGSVRHRFSVPAGTELVRARMPLRAKQKPVAGLALTWHDEKLGQLETVTATINNRRSRQQIDLFATVPEEASFGYLAVRSRGRDPIKLFETRLDFFASGTPEPDLRR